MSAEPSNLIDSRPRIRKLLKRLVAPCPPLYRLLVSLYHTYHFGVVPFVHTLLRRRPKPRLSASSLREFLSQQQILSFDSEIASVTTSDELRAWLDARGFSVKEGGWTLYLPPQPALEQHLPFLARVYPPGCGIKILKDFRSPQQARYTRHELNPSPGTKRVRSRTPSPIELVRVANYLHLHDLGPRVWDIVEFKSDQRSLTAYAVQHVEGSKPTREQYADFMHRLRAVLERGELTTPHGSISAALDFSPPDCNGNLIVEDDSGAPLNVDFQGFELVDEARMLRSIAAREKDTAHFGGSRLFRGDGSYLYQSIPGVSVGKRDIAHRWENFQALFADANLDLTDRIIFDIGCNTGLMLFNALAAGAVWGFGWDMPAVIGASRRILLTLGVTRFTLTPVVIEPQTDFASAVPERFMGRHDGVLFYLAVSNHIGFPDGIARLPWQYVIYEGHVGQSVASETARVRSVPWLKDAEVLATQFLSDGDTSKRPVILMRRRGGVPVESPETRSQKH